jgi:predicted Zn-ribbon and HTH transcriptional regulator
MMMTILKDCWFEGEECDMRQAGTFTDRLLAIDICEELRKEGIAAETTTQWQGAYSIQALTVVWVAEDAPEGLLATVVQVATTKREQQLKTPGTALDEHPRCRECGYDLRGQREDGRCPECGNDYELVKTRKCEGCGEEVPSDFLVCWNCGEELEEAAADQVGDD